MILNILVEFFLNYYILPPCLQIEKTNESPPEKKPTKMAIGIFTRLPYAEKKSET